MGLHTAHGIIFSPLFTAFCWVLACYWTSTGKTKKSVGWLAWVGVEAVVTQLPEVLMTSQRADFHKLLSEPDLTQEKVLLILLIWPL